MKTKKLYKILKETTKVYSPEAQIKRYDMELSKRICPYSDISGLLIGFLSSFIPFLDRGLIDKKLLERDEKRILALDKEKERYEEVNMILADIVVDKEKAQKNKYRLALILGEYPQPEKLAKGLNYIELSSGIGLKQEEGLRLMALGKVLGLWNIITPTNNPVRFDINYNELQKLARDGFLEISGYILGGEK